MVRPLSVFSGIILLSFASLAGERKLPWAFLPLKEADSAPAVQNTAWPKNRIDFFVLSKFEEAEMPPASQADARFQKLIDRQITFEHAGRDYRLTDVYGKVATDILS